MNKLKFDFYVIFLYKNVNMIFIQKLIILKDFLD